MTQVNIGDLVKMKSTMYDSKLLGIVLDKDEHSISSQIAITWLGGSGSIDWEPEAWLEVISTAPLTNA